MTQGLSNKVRIYKPVRTAMQQGKAKTKAWILEYEPIAPRLPEPIIGWVSSRDTQRQVILSFDTEAEALDYAKQNGLEAEVIQPTNSKIRRKSYADNFKFDKVEP